MNKDKKVYKGLFLLQLRKNTLSNSQDNIPLKKDLTYYCTNEITDEQDNSNTETVDRINYKSSTLQDERQTIINLKYGIEKKLILEEEKRKDKLVKGLVAELLMALDSFSEEQEELSSAERKIIEIEHRYSFRILGEVIQHVYYTNFNNVNYLVGVCKALLRYDFSEVKPWGPSVLSGLLNHPSDRVKEYVVQLIDNWHDIELLPMLMTIQVSSCWLNEYISDVVKDLQKEDVLHKKVI